MIDSFLKVRWSENNKEKMLVNLRTKSVLFWTFICSTDLWCCCFRLQTFEALSNESIHLMIKQIYGMTIITFKIVWYLFDVTAKLPHYPERKVQRCPESSRSLLAHLHAIGLPRGRADGEKATRRALLRCRGG